MDDINTNKLFIYKKLIHLSLINKSLLDSNRTTISNGIKNSVDTLNLTFYFKKIIKRNLITKYNITAFKYNLIEIQNIIDSKYCRKIAVFKENLIYYYKEEFLKRLYYKNESMKRIPKFFDYYINYLSFFCKPIFHELTLHQKLQKYYEKKAQIFFYINNKNNDKNRNERKKDKTMKNDEIIFTEKIKKKISNQNSMSQLSIKKRDNSSILTLYSFENSFINLLNEKEKKMDDKFIKTNYFERPKFQLRVFNTQNKREHSKTRIQNKNKKIKNNNNNNINFNLYNKRSRNIEKKNNMLFIEEKFLLSRNDYQKNKHLKIFSTHFSNLPVSLTERYKNESNKKTIIPLLKTNYNVKIKTKSLSIKDNNQNLSKKNKPKILSYISITPSKYHQVNFINSKSINKDKKDLNYKLSLNEQKNVSKIRINNLKRLYSNSKRIGKK